ncbi:MAG: winged helix-turn-helix domain-containing protein [Acidobacteriaceae bacterium]
MPEPIRFEEFDLDLERYELRRSGRALRLERKPMELLILLLKSEGRLVRREAINRHLWGENILQDTEHSVNTAVNKLRYILRDDPRSPRFIQTVVGQGYRFIGKVEEPDSLLSGPPFNPGPAEKSYAKPSGVAQAEAASEPAGESLQATDQEIAPLRPAPAVPVATLGQEDPPVEWENASRQTTAHTIVPTIPATIQPRRRAFRPWMALALGAAFLAGAAVWLLLHIWSAAPKTAAITGGNFSIAVLPFVNLAQNSNQDYVVDGMTDELITDLAGSTSLRVISRSSVMHYKGLHVPMSEIARVLNVDAVLEGSFLHNGEQVRITANLIDPRNDRHLWAQVYEESGDDLLSMQATVTNDIVRQVALVLGARVSPSRLRPVNVKARAAYLRGRYLWNQRNLNGTTRAIGEYQQAIKADPGYAEAYAALGDAYVLLAGYGDHPVAALDNAQEAADRALQLDDGLAEAHTVLGAVKTDRDWDWAGAEDEYRRATALNPSYPTAHHWYSLHLSRLGRARQAEEEIQRARTLDPLSAIIGTDAAQTAYWARRPREAMARVEGVLASDPYFAEAHLVKGKISEQLGNYDQALSEFKIALALFDGSSNLKALQAHALALGGASEQAQEMASQLEADAAGGYVSGADIAAVYCGLNQPDDAMRWLNRAYVKRDKQMDMLAVEPLFDGCRKDPRFQDLLRKLKLKPA